ncbi:MAG: zinc ABC transporter substrate-binding protein [Deltaproteobacteria bacterium]|nr:zinc ABC transporter substrate-binding protein [Deltaproteobacteria bacterium]
MKKYIFCYLVLITIAVSSAGHAAVRIITTIPDFGHIAKEVGGSHVDMEALVKPTQDPHFVDAKPSLMVKLNRADLLLITGMELEGGWLPPLLTGARNSKIMRGGEGYLDCSTLIPPMEVMAVDRSKGDIHPSGNPHYWTDPRNGIRMAKGIAKRLAEIDPSHAADYAAGRDRFISKLKVKIVEWEKKLAPHRGTKVVVYHESWIYFLDWTGFVKAGALEPKPGIPPKPSHVATLIKKVRGQGIKLVVQESFYPTRLSKIFAEKSGAALKVLPTMVGAGGTRDYFEVVDKLVNEFTK